MCRVALLAFHLATTEGKCSPVVIGAAALTMYHTTNRQKAAEKAIRIHAKLHKQVVSPGGEAESIDSAPVSNETVLEEATVLVENAKACLNRMMDAAVTTQVMQELTGAEPEDSVGYFLLRPLFFDPDTLNWLLALYFGSDAKSASCL